MAVTCDGCGVEADRAERLVEVRRSFSLRARRLCPRCAVERRRKRDRAAAWWNVGWLTLCGVSVASVTAWSDRGWSWAAVGDGLALMTIFVGAAVGGAIGLWLHELAHAAVARALGMKVWRLSVGAGRRWADRAWGDFVVEVRSWWVMGCVVAEPRASRFPAAAWALMVSAGPAANLLLAACAAAGWWSLPWGMGANFLGFFALTNGMTFALSAWPHMIGGSGGLPSDGMQLLRLLRDGGARHRRTWRLSGHATASTEMMSRGRAAEALARIDAGLADAGLFPEARQELESNRVVALIHAGRFREASRWGDRLLDDPGSDPQRRALLLNNRVWAGLMDGQVAQAAGWAREMGEARKSLPGVSALTSTTAACQIAAGALGEGEALMERAAAEDEDGDFCGVQLAWLAVAAARGGDAEQAADHLIAARRVTPESMEKEIDALVRHYLPPPR